MPTRREQLQSYQFVMQRVVSAFAYQDTDATQPAGRRLLGAGLGGVMIAVLAVAAVGIYALLRPGGNERWRDGNAVIVERETGTRFVFREGTLYPMANYASAMLVLDRPAKTMRVSASSLRGVPRGPLLGIVGAPDAVPPAGRALDGPWSVCAQPGQDRTGQRSTATTIHVGRPPGGADLGDDALLVQTSDTGRFFLVWHDHRHEIPNPQVAFAALGMEQQPRTVVDEAWVNTLPSGDRLVADPPDDVGEQSAALDDARIGQVYYVEGAGNNRQYYVVADDSRLAPATEVEAGLLLADPASEPAYPDGEPEPLPLSLSAVAEAEKLPAPQRVAGDLPATAPRVVGLTAADAAVCAEYASGQGVPRLVRDVPHGRFPPTTPRRTVDGVALADRVEVPAGWAAVVEALPSPEAPSGTRYLVTDLGFRHVLAGPDVQKALGYGNVRPVRVPADVVARIPAGPPLDPVVASRPVLG